MRYSGRSPQRKISANAKSAQGAASLAGRQLSALRCLSAGFTLVEILVATAIAGIIIVLVMDFTADFIKNSAVQEARDSLLSDAEDGLTRINQDIRLSGNADSINRWPDANSPGGALNLYGWQSNSNTLVLATAAEDSDHNILFTDPLHYITAKDNNIYFVSNGTLYHRTLVNPLQPGDAAKTTCPPDKATGSCPSDIALMHNVTNFTVTYIDADGLATTDTSNARAISLSVTLQTTKYNTPIKVSYETRTVFRNE